MQNKILALVVVLVLVIGVAIGLSFSKFLPPSIEGQQKTVKVTVVAEQVANMTFENGVYQFTYRPASGTGKGEGAMFTVITPGRANWYDANQGAVISVSGINVTVSEIYSNYIVLLIESNVPNNETP
jgi:uncharacterized protein YxeA